MPRREKSARPPAHEPLTRTATHRPNRNRVSTRLEHMQAIDDGAKPASAQPLSDPIETRGQHAMDIERPASDEPGSIQSIPSAGGTAPGEAAFVEPRGKGRSRIP